MDRSKSFGIAREFLPDYRDDEISEILDDVERTSVPIPGQEEESALRDEIVYYLGTRKSSGY